MPHLLRIILEAIAFSAAIFVAWFTLGSLWFWLVDVAGRFVEPEQAENAASVAFVVIVCGVIAVGWSGWRWFRRGKSGT